MDTLRLSAPKPRMIAHRGLSGIEMENTCSAFVAAGNRSYFGIETDVHVTADGGFIIIHDDSTKRVAIDALHVEESTFETLRSLRLCDKDGKRSRKDLCLPSLQEYIRICKKYEKVSVLELKNPMQPEQIDRIIEAVREEGRLEQTIFISFALSNMIHVRQALPNQKAQYLIEGRHEWRKILDILQEYDLGLDIDHRILTQQMVKDVHQAGKELNVWTVNTLEDARRLAQWGVDYITTNIIE
ncbi:MAG: hypothetical protein IK099_11195 [Clostridia bacterium]|nr:hypothetical protein [Clostridia bacterium]